MHSVGNRHTDLVGAVHFPTVVHCDEGTVAVVQVVIGDQGDRCKRNGLAGGIRAAVGDVCAGQTVKQIIWRAVLLKYDNNMLNVLGKHSSGNSKRGRKQ